jgi:CheY-like chemotaxis protein
MNGLEFIGVTRQNPELAKIPVIVLTSRTRDKYQRIAMELGASDYLTKPYMDQELLDTVGKNL